MLDRGARFRCSPDVSSRILDGEAVLLDLRSGKYFGLNVVGSRIWELLANGDDLGAIEATLAREFDADHATMADDLDDLVRELERRGLIVPS